MFTKKKLVNILCISLLISFALIISFFNLVSEEQGSENLAATLLYILIFVATGVIAFVLKNRAVLFFVFCYFAVMSLCLFISIMAMIVEIKYNAFYALCSMFVSPFYGFISITDHCAQASFAISALISLLSGFAVFKFLKGGKNNSLR